MRKPDTNEIINDMEGPNAFFFPKSTTFLVGEIGFKIRRFLEQSGYCNHFNTSKEIISGISKLLNSIRTAPSKMERFEIEFTNSVENENPYSFGFLFALSLLIAARIIIEHGGENYMFLEKLDGKYYCTLRFGEIKFQIERELEYCLNSTDALPKTLNEFIAHLHYK